MLFDAEEIASMIKEHRKLSISSVFVLMNLKMVEEKIDKIVAYDPKKMKWLEDRRKNLAKTLKDNNIRIKKKRKEIEKFVKKTNVKIKTIPLFDALSDELKTKNDIPKVVKDQYYVYQIVKETFV